MHACYRLHVMLASANKGCLLMLWFRGRLSPSCQRFLSCLLQAQALTVPDAVATCAHPLLSGLQRAVPSRAYGQAATLLVQLLQPDMHTRATAQQALASDFFNGT